jgi:hypothetical protein
LKQTLATCVFKCNIYLLLGQKWRLVDAELDTGVEVDYRVARRLPVWSSSVA